MTKLYMKQKVFSLRDRFTVKDESEQDRYYVEGELFTFGKKLHLYEMSGSEAAFIRQKLSAFLPCFEIFINGALTATVRKELSFMRPRFLIEGPGWRVEGSCWAHDYEIRQGEKTIASIHKAWFSWGDSYELEIEDPGNVVPALSVILCIDCVMDRAGAATGAASVNSN